MKSAHVPRTPSARYGPGRFGAPGLRAARTAAAVLLSGIAATAPAAPGGKDAAIFRDPAVPQAVFAAGEVRKALAAERYEEAERHLAADFLSRRGSRAQTRKAWEGGVRLSNIVSFAFAVEGYEKRDSFSMVLERRGERSWKGEIGIVNGSLTVTRQNLRTGKKRTMHLSPVVIAMRNRDGRWELIAQNIQSRNSRAGALAQKLYALLQLSFKSVTLWDGEKNILLYRELQSRLPKSARTAELSWERRSLTMTGEQYDTPKIRGQVTAKVAMGEGKFDTASHMVILTLELAGERLRLVSIDRELPGKNGAVESLLRTAKRMLDKSGAVEPLRRIDKDVDKPEESVPSAGREPGGTIGLWQLGSV